MKAEPLVELALSKVIVRRDKVQVAWGGLTVRSFPPVVLPDGSVAVLRRWTRTGERGRILWYEAVDRGGRTFLALALQVVD